MNKNEKLKDVNCICVFKDGNEVKAVAMRDVRNVFLEGSNLFTDYHGSKSKVVARASAKCNPDDIFDFNIGAKLALDRLYEGYDMTPKPKKKLYNGLIYIEKYPGTALKDKSIYRVKGGVIQKFTAGVRPFIYEGMSDEELSTKIDDIVWGRNTFSSYLETVEGNKFPPTVAHFIDNDKT